MSWFFIGLSSDITVSPLRDAVIVSIDDDVATPAHHTLPSTVDFIIRKDARYILRLPPNDSETKCKVILHALVESA